MPGAHVGGSGIFILHGEMSAIHQLHHGLPLGTDPKLSMICCIAWASMLVALTFKGIAGAAPLILVTMIGAARC